MSESQLELAQLRLAAANDALTTARRLGDVVRMEQVSQEVAAIMREIEQIRAKGD